VKQSMANRLLDLKRGPAPFPGSRLTSHKAALTGTAHPSFESAELGWSLFWPDLGPAAALPFPLQPAMFACAAGGVAGLGCERFHGRTP